MAAPEGYTHWVRTQGLILLILALWVLFSFGFHLFIDTLSLGEIYGLPVSFIIAGQGWLVGLIGMVVWFCRRQVQLDRLYRVEPE